MPVVDLTLEFSPETAQVLRQEITLQSANTRYTGVVYEFNHDSMQGTYIDFPGHIKETENGESADNFPLGRLYRVPASVIHLERAEGSGAVTAAELEKAFGGVPRTETLIINALGPVNTQDIDSRSVYLDASAVEWIIASGCKLLVSDIYESKALEGVFLRLFEHGISTICEPVNLWGLPPQVELTVLFARIKNVTQLPCRMIAEY